MQIINQVGPPVAGNDFYGRTLELKRAHQLLDTGHSLVLSAPRRIGKSSFAKRLIDDKTVQGWKCAYIDLEGVHTRDEFLTVLLDEFKKSGLWQDAAVKASGIINQLLESVKGIGPVQLDFSKPESSDNLYTTLAQSLNHDKETLVVIDELTLFLGILDRDNPEAREAEFLLNWLRSLRQVQGSKIRWILCGSVGLHNFTRMRNLSMTINDTVAFDFDALCSDEAYGLLSALCVSAGLNMPEDVKQLFLDKIEWHIPYFIQLLFNILSNYATPGQPVTETMLETAYEQLAHSDNLNTWSDRLAEYNGYEDGARLLLKAICQSDGLTRDSLLDEYMTQLGITNRFEADKQLSTILNMIEHDGYITRTTDSKRKFRSPLLRLWWRYNFVD